MIRILLPLLLTASLSGCASLSHPLPKCDGHARRSLNRSMWQWEGDAKLQKLAKESIANPSSSAVPFAEEPVPVKSAAFAHFDIEGSKRPCEGS